MSECCECFQRIHRTILSWVSLWNVMLTLRMLAAAAVVVEMWSGRTRLWSTARLNTCGVLVLIIFIISSMWVLSQEPYFVYGKAEHMLIVIIYHKY